MFLKPEVQRTLTDSPVEEDIYTWIETFLIDRKARGCAKGTLVFYQQKMKAFADYCDSQVVSQISQITPTMVRQYLLYLEDTGHNPGGRHFAYRAFLFWFEDEVEPDNWSNPVHKVKAPEVPLEPLEPLEFETVSLMMKACESNTFCGIRDKALLLFLLDTGVRAGELLAINIEDINQARGDTLIRHSKGKRPRYVYISKHSKRALRGYLNQQKDENPALWVTHPRFNSGRLKYDSLRAIMTRRAKQASIKPPVLLRRQLSG
jgi:integrase/recombinase XerD